MVDQKTPYTLHAARKYVWVRWCMMCLNPKCTTSMGHAKYITNRTPYPTPSLIQYLWCQFPNFEAAAVGSHACAQTLFCLAWDTSIYIYTSIQLYSVRITLKVARWMKPIRQFRDGKSEHYWPSVGYHLHSTRFCHMYNLEDSMVELKHNAQTSKHKHFSFVL